MQYNFMTDEYTRRLPVYLLLDCSGSMAGEAIIAVNEGLGMIYRLLMADPQALETVHISVICFSDHADQYGLTPIDKFQPPALTASGTTAMGAALRLLIQSIEQDLLLNTPVQHGDFRPLVFLLTDGAPTDAYRNEIQKLKSLRGSQKPTIVALGCGTAVNQAMLHEVTDNVFLMQTITSEKIKAFFKWISGSIIQTSHAAGSDLEPTIYMPPPGSYRSQAR
ncbi:MAG TPA: VWA domain-containing protein [Ktedonobacteraceae bacterium]|nr:VWA domain-containing protein [Ktedonobacteraceae bacterium]